MDVPCPVCDNPSLDARDNGWHWCSKCQAAYLPHRGDMMAGHIRAAAQEIMDHLQKRWVDRVRHANWKHADQQAFEAIKKAVWAYYGQTEPPPI